jgi:hypothetical protein
VQGLPVTAQSFRWLDRNDVVPSLCQGGRIPAGAGPKIEHPARLRGKEVQHVSVDLLERDAFVLVNQGRRVLLVTA